MGKTRQLTFALMVFAAGHGAQANETLAKKNDCLGCHATKTVVVGPSYQAVAAKYAGQAGAEDQLVKSIREGSVGQWGDLAMPPHPKLSDADAHKLAKWILSTK